MQQTNVTLEKFHDLHADLEQHPFVPPLFATNYHLQILAFLLTPIFTVQTPKPEKRIIDVANGNQIAVNCWWQKDAQNKPSVIVVNGFEGYSESGESKYSTGIGYKAFYYGYNVLFLQQRGEGPLVKQTSSIGDFLVEDIPIALKEIASWNTKNKYIVSLSLGAWSTAIALGKLGTSLPKTIAGFVSVSAPTNTKETWNHIEKNAFFDWFLLQKYKSLIKRRIKIDPPGTWDEAALNGIKTKQQFFETYMHLFGYPTSFATLDEYFQKYDSLRYLTSLATPTLIINAKDDPVVPHTPFTQSAIQDNKNIITLFPEYGSHGCFIAGKKYKKDLDLHWSQNRAMQFIQEIEKL